MPTKILYVEDEVFLAKIVAESLESREYDVRWVSDGGDALNAFSEHKPDICILDIMLPNRDGLEIGKEIRELSPAVPIIYLTAKGQTADVLKGFASGGNDYLKKPFSIEELIVRIENLLSITTGNAQYPKMDAYSFGVFQYNPLKMELTTEGVQPTKLSHRENELLNLLVQNRNKPVERRRILKELWGDDSFFNSRNLDVYITRLRKHLKADESVKINTLKGVGYQFVAI